VVVSYNSRSHLRNCVEPLSRLDDVHVTVVDNASSDGSLETVADLEIERIGRPENGGFAKGCNDGWRAGNALYVLFLNPDATIDEPSLRRLAKALAEDEHLGAAAPRIVHDDGSLAFSQRRFPRLCSTYARALFLHRLLPNASWTDEVVRDDAAYAHRTSPEWVSGACVLVRRRALEQLGGWDDGFFFYGEDIDLCRRLWRAGWAILYEPEALVRHHEGASTPSSAAVTLLAASRLRYAAKHRSRLGAAFERVGVALEALARVVVSRRRLGHAHAFVLALTRRVEKT
jgi:GT2 family glycosyltransferase